jgi:hypothetical protein
MKKCKLGKAALPARRSLSILKKDRAPLDGKAEPFRTAKRQSRQLRTIYSRLLCGVCGSVRKPLSSQTR